MTVSLKGPQTKKKKMPACLPQFRHINRFQNPAQGFMPTAKLLPGEYYVTKNDEALTTVLGSCIACCIYDLEAGIGGMNHFMLPHLNEDGGSPNWDMSHPDAETRFGNFAMEKLINEVMKNGGRRSFLQFKIFGGGNILNSASQYIGKRNIEFTKHFIANEGFQLTSSDTGSKHPRKVVFYPMSGRVQVKKLGQLKNNTLSQREDNYEKQVQVTFKRQARDKSDVELF